MLSRVAESLYWLSRYLERAEHTARLLDLNLHGMIDQRPDLQQQRWERVRCALRLPDPLPVPVDGRAASRSLTFDAEQSDAVVSCITRARENARQVREHLSSEMWERLNRLYLDVVNPGAPDRWAATPSEFYASIKEGAHLFQGLTDAMMSHNVGWHFMQIGRFLERVMATTHLLDVHFSDPAEPGDEFSADRYLDWVGLLKSCTAFEAYCRVHTAQVQPVKVAAFLVFNAEFPRSVRFGVNMVLSGLNTIAETTPARRNNRACRLAGRLSAELNFDQVDDIMDGGLGDYLGRIHGQCHRIHEAIYTTYIQYPIESALSA